jgi:ornithine decarboxylase
MEKFASAVAFLQQHQPDRPVWGIRPQAAGRAARWFLANFPGEVAYAYKANSSVFLLGALHGAGIKQFDVASIPELEDAATIPGVLLHYMHPVKSRKSIRRAYHEFGVRCFALDCEEELEKIVTETSRDGVPAKDLQLYVRVAVPAKNSRIPLERKFGVTGVKAAKLLVKTRQAAAKLRHRIPCRSQTTSPDAYTNALKEVHRPDRGPASWLTASTSAAASVGLFDSQPAPLGSFMNAIRDGMEKLPVTEACRLICEPGRALVAEAESLIVRVDLRKGNDLYINDGSYGALFDAAHLGFVFPTRLVSRPAEAGPAPFEMWGPTCDSIDRMRGPFMLPAGIREATTSKSATSAPTPRDRQPLQRFRQVRGGHPARRADRQRLRRQRGTGCEERLRRWRTSRRRSTTFPASGPILIRCASMPTARTMRARWSSRSASRRPSATARVPRAAR